MDPETGDVLAAGIIGIEGAELTSVDTTGWIDRSCVVCVDVSDRDDGDA